MQKIKVLLINDFLERGGIETLILDFISFSENKAESVEVSLLLKQKKGEIINDLPIKTNLFIIERKKIFDIKYLLSLRKFLKLNSFNIIHTHTPVSGFYLFLAKVGLHIPMVQTIHGFWDKRAPSGKLHVFHLSLTYFLTFVCNKTITVSQYMKEECIKSFFPKKNLIVIYNGINFSKFKTSIKNIQNKNSTKDKVTFGMVGSFNYVRSHETLLKAFIKLSENYLYIILKLAGDGELLEYCKKLAVKKDEKIIFIGRK